MKAVSVVFLLLALTGVFAESWMMEDDFSSPFFADDLEEPENLDMFHPDNEFLSFGHDDEHSLFGNDEDEDKHESEDEDEDDHPHAASHSFSTSSSSTSFSSSSPPEETVVISNPAETKAALSMFGKMFSSMASAFGAPPGAVLDKEFAVQHYFSHDVYNLMKKIEYVKKDKSLSKSQKKRALGKLKSELVSKMEKAFAQSQKAKRSNNNDDDEDEDDDNDGFGSSGFHLKWKMPAMPPMPAMHMDNSPPPNGKVISKKWVTNENGMKCVHTCKKSDTTNSKWNSCSTSCSSAP